MKVANAILIGIKKTAWINLIDHRASPPGLALRFSQDPASGVWCLLHARRDETRSTCYQAILGLNIPEAGIQFSGEPERTIAVLNLPTRRIAIRLTIALEVLLMSLFSNAGATMRDFTFLLCLILTAAIGYVWFDAREQRSNITNDVNRAEIAGSESLRRIQSNVNSIYDNARELQSIQGEVASLRNQNSVLSQAVAVSEASISNIRTQIDEQASDVDVNLNSPDDVIEAVKDKFQQGNPQGTVEASQNHLRDCEEASSSVCTETSSIVSSVNDAVAGISDASTQDEIVSYTDVLRTGLNDARSELSVLQAKLNEAHAEFRTNCQSSLNSDLCAQLNQEIIALQAAIASLETALDLSDELDILDKFETALQACSGLAVGGFTAGFTGVAAATAAGEDPVACAMAILDMLFSLGDGDGDGEAAGQTGDGGGTTGQQGPDQTAGQSGNIASVEAIGDEPDGGGASQNNDNPVNPSEPDGKDFGMTCRDGQACYTVSEYSDTQMILTDRDSGESVSVALESTCGPKGDQWDNTTIEELAIGGTPNYIRFSIDGQDNDCSCTEIVSGELVCRP